VLTHTARLVLSAVLLLPLVPLVIWSFAGRWVFPDLVPAEWALRGWLYLTSPAARVGEAMVNSLVVAGATTGIALMIGLPAARALARGTFPGRRWFERLLLLPVVVPTLAAAMGIQVVIIRLGLNDTLLGVILVHLIPVLPYVVLTLTGVFANVDPDYEAQARTLGAGRWQVWLSVIVPAVLPGVVVSALFAALISWSQYLLTLLVGGGAVRTLPVILLAFVNSGDFAVAAVLSLVFIAPALLAQVLTARYLTGQSAAIARL
jgi:putative spermidine/putrescine transport system permease protein